METKEHWFKCCTNRVIGGTYIVQYGYDFTCARCGKRHRSAWNIIAHILGLIPEFAND